MLNTLDDLLRAILPILPDAQVGEDNAGQVVIYTGLTQRKVLAPLSGRGLPILRPTEVNGFSTLPWRVASEDDIDSDFYAIRVTTERDLNDIEAWTMFSAIGYAFRQFFRGERLGEPVRLGTNDWAAYYDITKSRSDDWLLRFPDAMDAARQYIIEGSPIRKRDRKRLVEGLGFDPKPRFQFD